MFKIGEFSNLCRIPVSALRFYADLGLLDPAHIDAMTGYRCYSADQLPRLNRILALKDLGLSLEQIKQALDDDLTLAEMRGMLRLKQAEIEQHVLDEQARLQRVATRLHQIEQEGKMPEQEVVLKQVEGQRVLSIRETVPTPAHVGTLLNESFGAMMSRAIQPSAPPIAIFHDNEFKPENMDVEIALPVGAAVKDNVPLDHGRALTIRDMPAIQMASIIHKGDYGEAMTPTYDAIAYWIERNGYKIVGPSREVYLAAADGENEPITEIQFPIAKS